MKTIGFLIPTIEEASMLPADSQPYITAGFGAGKAAACAMAADLIFNKHCSTIILWGTAGGISPQAVPKTCFIASRVAYSDYDIRPLFGSTGIGFVRDITSSEGWLPLNAALRQTLRQAMAAVYPDILPLDGSICSADHFSMPGRRSDYNRIESEADAVDMETMAVAEFIERLNRHNGTAIAFGAVRFVSNTVGATKAAGEDFCSFLSYFCSLNQRLGRLRQELQRLL